MVETPGGERSGKTPGWVRALLWVVALLLMLGAAAYQRRTGPTYPLRGEVAVGGESFAYALVRSGTTGEEARVAIPDLGGEVTAQLFYRRYKTGEPFIGVPMERKGGEMVAHLPSQPPAGKLEYYLVLTVPGGEEVVPEADAGTAVIRFKDGVPGAVLLPHVLLMFLAMLVGVRAGLGALVAPEGVRRQAWFALAGITLGGLVLGPIVQKYAFGEYWTGFPFGYDLTDNKTLIMWLAWLAAALAVGWKARAIRLPQRALVVVAAVVMIAVYLIPHSLRGSELNYQQLDQGVPASEAIETG